MRRLAQKLLIVVLLGSSLVASFAVVGQGQQQGITRSSALQQQKLPEITRRGKHGLSNVLSVRRGGRSPTQLQSTGALVVLDTFWKANPLIAAAVVCATKSTLADIVAQRRQHHQQQQANITNGGAFKLDSRRTLSFMIYGALYQGMAQELIYNNFYTFLFGSASTPRVVAKKVLFDAFFHNALVCIPMAYAVKAFVFQYSLVTGIRQYIDDVMHHGLLLKYYAIWMPVNAMIFTIVPPHWRITVMAVVSFFWMIVLSTISSRSRET